jgi:phosphatidate cytidylyltransferase
VLGRRLLSASIIISVMLVLLRIDYWLGSEASLARPGLVLCVLAMALATMAAGELVQLWPPSPRKPGPWLVSNSVGLMVFISCLPLVLAPVVSQSTESLAGNVQSDSEWLNPFAWTAAGIFVAFLLSFVVEMLRYRVDDSGAGFVTDRLGRSAFVFVYLSMLFGFLVPHRLLDHDNAVGLISLIALIATVKLSDSFAYFAGKSFGTIKLAPRLSPKKTVQGAIGAVVGGCLATAIVVFLVAPMIFGVNVNKPWWWFLVYGLLVTVAGMVGDLAESLLKRDANVKDSSSWLPGLGGVLDVLDSLMFAAPVSYVVWNLFTK